jgi:hypothetical protein
MPKNRNLSFVLPTENYYSGREAAYVHSHPYFKEKYLDDSVNYNQKYFKEILLYASEDRKLICFTYEVYKSDRGTLTWPSL